MVFDRALGKLNVAAARIVDPVCLPDSAGTLKFVAAFGFENIVFNARLDIVGQFESVRAEDFDSVVIGGIVRGGNHDAAIRAKRFRQMRNGGRRHRTDLQHVHAHADQAAGQGGFKHIAGEPGIFAEHGFGGIVSRAEDVCDGFSDAECGFRSNRIDIGLAPDAVGAEQFSHNETPFLKKPDL